MKTEKGNKLLAELQTLKTASAERDVPISEIIDILAGKGHAILIILLSLPFCQPIQIPGSSTPFGLLIAFFGLRIAFGHHPWLPEWLLNKKISSSSLRKILDFGIRVANALKNLLKTRQTWLFSSQILIICHGLTVTLLGLFLALPLPIPLSNMIASWTILAFGFGLLEEDGVAIMIGYGLAWVTLIAFLAIFWLGAKGFMYLAA